MTGQRSEVGLWGTQPGCGGGWGGKRREKGFHAERNLCKCMRAPENLGMISFCCLLIFLKIFICIYIFQKNALIWGTKAKQGNVEFLSIIISLLAVTLETQCRHFFVSQTSIVLESLGALGKNKVLGPSMNLSLFISFQVIPTHTHQSLIIAALEDG